MVSVSVILSPAAEDARARAVNSSNHGLKMTASFTFDYRIVVLDRLQFSNQMDRLKANQGQQCQ